MCDGKRAALGLALPLGLALLLGIGIATDSALREESAATAVRATPDPAPLTRVGRLALAESLAPPSVAPRAGTVASDTTTFRSSRSDALADSVIAAARATSAPSALSREPQPRAAGPSFRILLEPLTAAPDAVTASFAGRDTGAPRMLELWRVDAGRAQWLGRAASDADARIHAPQLALPAAGIQLVVTPLGVRPGEPGSSQPLRLARAPHREDIQARGSPRWRHAALAPSPEGESR